MDDHDKENLVVEVPAVAPTKIRPITKRPRTERTEMERESEYNSDMGEYSKDIFEYTKELEVHFNFI